MQDILDKIKVAMADFETEATKRVKAWRKVSVVKP